MLPLKHPFTALVVGPTCCGKTQFVFKLIDNVDRMIDPPPNRIVYCYGEYQQSFRKYPNVEFRQGLPHASDFDGSEPVLLVIDDLMQETDETVANLFTKGSHHRNVSVVFLAQNLFPKKQVCKNHESQRALHSSVQESERRESVCKFVRCTQSNGSSPWKHIRTRCENRTVICCWTSDLNRTKT